MTTPQAPSPKGKAKGSKRRGAVIPLMAVFVVVLLAMAAFSIDVAYMELVQTQLKAGTDAAAKAGTSSLVQGKTDQQAMDAAIAMAAKNGVAGHPLRLTAADIKIGQSQQQADGTWKFVEGVKPSQAMQITSSLNDTNANGSVPLFFAPVIGTNKYTTSNVSEASAFACEVCLVLDRSHSMCFDQSGTTWQYPAPFLLDWILGIKNKPAAGSRWLALDSSVNTFCNILSTANAPPRVALVTWATNIGTNTTEYSLTKQTSPAVTTDLQLTSNMSSVYNAVHNRSLNVILGGTDMSGGMDAGRAVLTGTGVRSYAKKIMILMTDGQWNAGRDPVLAANDCDAADITVHCICFLQNADQTTTQQVAAITGGKFYYASNAAALDAAFRDLAYTLPVVLTK